ncbi:hypothetical protein [Streptomyces sp. NPDC057280]|uniref:hypothetical protein n=1 Tax=Streptomyces sp. NPDC057280 TaxID=3346081 RepID=UPI0009A38627|nr:hypothetical protein B1R27_00620 [Streptomyces sp. GKU 895]
MRHRLAICTVAAILPTTAALSLTAATQAQADPAKATVTVTGSVEDCPTGSPAVKVTITTSKESRTDKTDVDDTGEYSVKFTKISKAGLAATATVTCEDGNTYKDKFKIKRPTGTSLIQETDIEAP